MKIFRQLLVIACFAVSAGAIFAQVTSPEASPRDVVLTLPKGITNAFVMRSGAAVWDPAYDGQALHAWDSVQTRRYSRVLLTWPDGATMQLDQLSDYQITPDPNAASGLGLLLKRARLYFFHRGQPTELKIRTGVTSAAVRGTEFELEANEAGELRVTVLNGEVLLANAAGEVLLGSNEQGFAGLGRPPTKTAVIDTVNIVQWCLYYPAVLDPGELEFTPEAGAALQRSLQFYRSGDLLRALEAYPQQREAASPDEALYFSELLLSVGQVKEAEAMLAVIETTAAGSAQSARWQSLSRALGKLVAAVKNQDLQEGPSPPTASEWLAKSYYRQSRRDLDGALRAAQQATAISPDFGFAWARVAELEFCFGRTHAARRALDRASACAPRNAQAHALKGFLLAAENRLHEAIAAFDQAIAIDPALGNAWLGRGLCRIRSGDLQGGLQDLKTAAALEPNRSLLRSYLGKAYTTAGDYTLGNNELNGRSIWTPKTRP